jgi:hypothetical protein
MDIKYLEAKIKAFKHGLAINIQEIDSTSRE